MNVLYIIVSFGIGYVFGRFHVGSNLRKSQRYSEEHPEELYSPDSISDWERWGYDKIPDGNK